MCLQFVMNGVFYTDDQLSSRYEKGTLTFAQDLLRSIPSNVISAIICAIFKSLVSYAPLLEMLFVEVKKKKFVFFIQKIYCSLIRTFVFFHFLLFILIIFSLYYLALFSIIYKSSQISLFIGFLYILLTSIIINVSITVALTIMRAVSIAYQPKYLYNFELYLNKIL